MFFRLTDFHTAWVYLDYVECEKDLGVMESSRLNWTGETNALTKKAKGILGLLKRVMPLC